MGEAGEANSSRVEGGDRDGMGGHARRQERFETVPDRHPPDHGTTPSPRSLSVLLVEDDAITLEFISRLLADAGASVVEAASVREALAALEAGGPFDLLLTDYALLDGTGVDVARAARGRARRTVLVSGELASVPLDDARDAGVELFVPKFELTSERVARLLEELFG